MVSTESSILLFVGDNGKLTDLINDLEKCRKIHGEEADFHIDDTQFANTVSIVVTSKDL